MPPLDRKKEELSEIRRWQGYCVTIIIALVAFIAMQYGEVSNILIYISFALVVVLGVAVVVFAKKINKIIDEIGRL